MSYLGGEPTGITPGFLNQPQNFYNTTNTDLNNPIFRSPFSCPCYMTKKFGKYVNSDNSHLGEDYIPLIQSEDNWKLYSMSDGVVTGVGNQLSNLGYFITISSGIYSITYSHLKELPNLKVDDKITSGDLIGIVGNTGNSIRRHLHLEIKDNLGNYIIPSNLIDLRKFE